MKISELTQITAVRRDIKLPLSIAGQNMSISLGQIIDAISQDVVPFSSIAPQRTNVQYASGTPTANIGAVIFDSATNKFYCAIGMKTVAAGQIITKWTYCRLGDPRQLLHRKRSHQNRLPLFSQRRQALPIQRHHPQECRPHRRPSQADPALHPDRGGQ